MVFVASIHLEEKQKKKSHLSIKTPLRDQLLSTVVKCYINNNQNETGRKKTPRNNHNLIRLLDVFTGYRIGLCRASHWPLSRREKHTKTIGPSLHPSLSHSVSHSPHTSSLLPFLTLSVPHEFLSRKKRLCWVSFPWTALFHSWEGANTVQSHSQTSSRRCSWGEPWATTTTRVSINIRWAPDNRIWYYLPDYLSIMILQTLIVR